MKVEILNADTFEEQWQTVKNLAMNTIGKETGKAPTEEWKTQMLRCEHSPIRSFQVRFRFTDIPYWVAMHLVRHKIGVEWFVSTQRTDRTKLDRNNLPQNSLVSLTGVANLQALITISRKRLCLQASEETRNAWNSLELEMLNYDDSIYLAMVRECIYRGFCPEFKCCGYINSTQGQTAISNYRGI